ncbi:MAG: hypothetical protein HY660_00555 [Armatimonadetes bacterium]|nr:hypothetical protein [Armatimonadota bacterium]
MTTRRSPPPRPAARWAFANESGARIFIHCAQSEMDVAALRGRGHDGAVRCLAACGVLGPDLVAAHCIYIDGDEVLLAMAGERGITVESDELVI